MTSFKRSQAKYVKNKYRVRNWPKYEAGLRSRGSLTVWISEKEIGSWSPAQTSKKRRGGQKKYSNHAIETALTVGIVFHLPLRQTEGSLASLFELLDLSAPVPDHTTISRRAAKLGKIPFYEGKNCSAVHILVDSSGLPAVALPEWQSATAISEQGNDWGNVFGSLRLDTIAAASSKTPSTGTSASCA